MAKLKLPLLIVGLVALVFVAGRLWRTPAWQRGLSQVENGMTVEQVREVMGRDEETPNGHNTANGEFERSWMFAENGVRCTVAFDKDGRVIYREFGPSYCGTTWLSGKFVQEQP